MPRLDPRLRHWAIRLVSAATPLWRLAAAVIRRTRLRRTRFIVVVGSYGKTTTARAVSHAVLGGTSPTIERNARLWVPLAVLRTAARQRHQVLEVGISKPGQMARAARVVQPTIAVVTSIGSEHHRSLGSLELTRAEKAKMVEALPKDGVAVLNGDDEHVRWMASRVKCRIVTWGERPDCDVQLADCRLEWPRGMYLTLVIEGTSYGVQTRLLGNASAGAVVAAAAVCYAEGLPIEGSLQSLASFEPSRGRLQLVALPQGVHLIRDDYKSSYETIETALDVLESVPSGRKICVLGEVSEPPGSQGAVYKALGERVARAADVAVFVANRENARRYAVGAKQGGMLSSSIIRIDQNPLAALAAIADLIEPNDTVLIKGRDNQKLGRIALGLGGARVGCAIRVCRLHCAPCEPCTRLETGWSDHLLEVP